MVVAGPSHLFRLDGETLHPSELVRGPWDHGLQHGGAVSGALGWLLTRALAGPVSPGGGTDERAEATPERQLCRLTTEILRPVPVRPLRYRTKIVHRGRRSQVVEAELLVDDRVVARASSQWATRRPDALSDAGSNEDENDAGINGFNGGSADAVAKGDAAVPRRPAIATDPGALDIGYPRPGFNCDVFELRCLVGSTEEPGPGTIWTRMMVDVVAGHRRHPVDRVAAVADLANAVGWERSPNEAPMINPDLTLQLIRYPRGEWICLEAEGNATAAGIGMMETTLWDGDGRFGRVLSTTIESPVSLAVEL